MQSRKKILITGGSGMIGNRLTELLIQNRYEVSHVGRSKKTKNIRTFIWDPRRGEIEDGAIRDIDVIIHLAGAGIADKRWNEKWKEEILFSRTQSTRLLKETLAKEEHRVNIFISASGIGYYGLEEKGSEFVESDAPGQDFMARVATAWEGEVDKMHEAGLRIVKIRTGVVLSREGGALKKLADPVKFFVGASLGSGKQLVNWIHIDDLCRIFIRAIEDPSMQGPYNAVAPQPVTNKTLTVEIARALKRPLWLPPVPGFVVKLIAGDVAEIVLKGGKVSSQKIEREGFDFQFKDVRGALIDLLATKSRPYRNGTFGRAQRN
ncbi:MAG: TIGR01777 family oxidoreductase [Cyclobacteriaceae bacterium]